MVYSFQRYEDYKKVDDLAFDELPAGWTLKKVKHLFNIGRGRVISQEELDDNGVFPVYSSQTQNNGCLGFINTYDFDCKQITWTTDGANAGTVFLREGKHNCTNVCGTLQPINKNLNFSFYLYSLQYITQFHKRPDTNGAKIMNGEMAAISLCIPSDNEQQKIANFLDYETAKIDTLINKQEELIKLLKEKRQAVISHAVTKGLNPDAPMKDSGVEWLGEVPEHWDVTKFSYAIDFLEGPGILAADFHDEGVPLLRIQNVKEVFVTDNFKTYLDPLKVKEKWDHFRVEKGDLLISASASTGLISEVDERTVGAVPYTGLIRLKPMTQDITAGFIRYIVQSDLFYEQIKLLQTGSTIQHFGPIHLQQMKVILPPVDEQDKIVDQIQQSVKHIDSLIESAYRIIDLTKERKTALISAAVTGKIDVRDWQEPTYQESAQR
ncbi:restriction endonuclease subunit S [Vibrio vulnificus]|uniref:restriction endonuclease subunit S n=1 Tax=Vibrio vulnificus TaxID=672 RepID=UPI001EEA2F66|nr:restriction endonuclease subunit S [Vibrio vulnificus]MCG6285918.1 restriction endonuclease subunit S [Vibrio vulnificus]